MNLLLIAVGGALGAILRYLSAQWIGIRYQQSGVFAGFPVATLTINAIGSFLIGFLFIVIQQRFSGHASYDLWRGFLLIGLLGGFTTFSTFSLETLQLMQLGLWGKAMLNIISSIVVCLVAVFAGVATGRLLS